MPKSGGTFTGRVTTAKPFNQIITGTGIKGSKYGSNYIPALWNFNTGVTPTDGDIITIKIPVAVIEYGVYMTINGHTSNPVAISGTTRLTNEYNVGQYLTLQYEQNNTV
jgi:hypothetical protein